MNQKDSLFLRDWILIAKKDWERISRQIKDGDPEAAGYFLQPYNYFIEFTKVISIHHFWQYKALLSSGEVTLNAYLLRLLGREV